MTALHEQMQDNDLAAVAAFGDIVQTIIDELKVYVEHGLRDTFELSLIEDRFEILKKLADSVNARDVSNILNGDLGVLAEMQNNIEDQLDFYKDELHDYAELWNDINTGEIEYTKETIIDEDFRDD